MRSLVLQLPPRELGAAARDEMGPPLAAIFISLPPAKKPMKRPSGDQNGCEAPEVPSSCWGASLLSERTKSSLVSPEWATKAILSPCGDRTGMRSEERRVGKECRSR